MTTVGHAAGTRPGPTPVRAAEEWTDTRAGVAGGAAEEGTSRARALLLLALFVLGCAVAAVGVALLAGAVWQGLFGWAMPQVVGDVLPG